MILFREKYAPGSCRYNSGYKEIRWDVVGCNLQCQFCWSPASRTGCASVKKDPRIVYRETLSQSPNVTDTFIRFTGGEPTLFWDDISTIFDYYEADTVVGSIPILIQTNGIEIGRGNVDLDGFLSRTKQRYLVELSMKGTNRDEFALLTGRDSGLYEYQLKAYTILHNISMQNPNVRIVAVLGIYHSSVNGNSKYAFVNPTNGKILFDDSTSWDITFRKIWSSAPIKWVEPLRMSPKGVWDNLYRRCGPEGSRILQYFPNGTDTNAHRLFPAKPKSFEYARRIVQKDFWHR